MKFILILTYLVTTSPSAESPSNCVPMPKQWSEIECIHGATPEPIIPAEPEELVLNVYVGPTAREDCVAQAVRYAEGKDILTGDIILRISGSVAESFICRGSAK